MANNPRSEERAWEVGRRLAEAVGCSGEPGTLLPCLQVNCNHIRHPNAQGIEDGFALLEAFDYGPYPVVDKVLQFKSIVIVFVFSFRVLERMLSFHCPHEKY